MDSNHCEVVEKSITGERSVDEQTFASLEILGERLEHLRDLDPVFSCVTFSREVMELQAQHNTLPVR